MRDGLGLRREDVNIESTLIVNIKKTSEFDIYIGRKHKIPHHYGNPFIIGVHGDREEVITKFRLWLKGVAYTHIEPERRKWILNHLGDLRDKVLGCYCKPERCHGDVYVELLREGY